jgi:hypothetical protein
MCWLEFSHEFQHRAREIGAGIFMKSGFSRLQICLSAARLSKTRINNRQKKRST